VYLKMSFPNASIGNPQFYLSTLVEVPLLYQQRIIGRKMAQTEKCKNKSKPKPNSINYIYPFSKRYFRPSELKIYELVPEIES